MDQRDSKILVLGATGNQGRAVIRHLVAGGFTNVHALVRAAGQDQRGMLDGDGVTVVTADLDDTASIEAVMQGSESVFAVLPLSQDPDTDIRRGRAVAEAALHAGVSHFVYSSASGAGQAPGVPDFSTKYAIEQHVRGLGLPATVIRPVAFMENYLTFEHPLLVDGVALFRAAVHPGTVRQMIAADDIGQIAADVLARPDETLGQTIEIAGDELTAAQIPGVYTRVTGQPARFEEQPVEEVRAFDPAFADMFTWLTEQGFQVDIPALRAQYPALTSFESWLAANSAAVMPR